MPSVVASPCQYMRLEPDRRNGVRRRSEQPRPDPPERADGRIDGERSQGEATATPGPSDSDEIPSRIRKLPYTAPTPAGSAKTRSSSTRERIVDQERVLRFDLVRVEQVVPPVGSARRERARDVPGRARGRTRRYRRAPRPRCASRLADHAVCSCAPENARPWRRATTTSAEHGEPDRELGERDADDRDRREQNREGAEPERRQDGQPKRRRSELGRQQRKQRDPAGREQEERSRRDTGRPRAGG